jgi:serine/threonine protein kinase
MSSPLHFGKYLLVDKIGTGGMAELYLAKQTGLKGFEKVLAIKRILPHLTQDTEFINMFINEAKLAALLSHQNIVQIFDLGNVDGIYYIAMEYVMGKDLRTMLRKRKERKTRIPVELALTITSRMCSGLDYAHRKKDLSGNDLNIVHRDVSPQNILISYEGEVKIVDFGIAKAASSGSETKAGVLKGKLAYMSPEQAWGKPIDRRTDVFATGVVLYEMLAGERPFKATSDFDLLEKVREAKLDPPSKLNPEVYPELEAAVMKSLSKDPTDRYQTTSEMEMALETLIVSKGHGLSSLNLSQYMSALFKEEMEQDTQRFQMATTLNLSETLVERTVRQSPPPKTPTGDTPRVDRTPSGKRTSPTIRQPQPRQETHAVLNLFLWGALLLLISVPILAYTKPYWVLKVIQQSTWLHPIEKTVRLHMENLDLIQASPAESDITVSTQSEPPIVDPAVPQHVISESTPVPLAPAPAVPSPSIEQETPSPQEPKQIAMDIPVKPVRPPKEINKQGMPPSQGPIPPRMRGELRQLFAVAKRQYEERDLEGLETTLRKIIEKDPEAARAYHLLGMVYMERKDEEAALRIFSEAVNLFPSDPMLHHDLGSLYYKRGFHELARLELSKALEISPNFPKAEESRQLLMALQKTGPLHPVVEPPPPSPPQPNPDHTGEMIEQKTDEALPQSNAEPTAEGEPQDLPEPTPPEAGSE